MDNNYLPETLEHRLAHVIKECGEVQQVAGKILWFGWYSVNPHEPHNLKRMREVDDLIMALTKLKASMSTFSRDPGIEKWQNTGKNQL